LFIFFPKYVPEIKLQFAGIVLCFIMSMFLNGENKVFIRLGLFITVISDYLILLTKTDYVISVFIFSFVHLIYGYKLYKEKSIKSMIYIRLGLFIITEIIMIFLFGFDLLLLVSTFYFINLLANCIHGVLNYKINLIFAVGIILFLLCDIFVGINNINEFINIPQITFPINFMWLFYFPSQVLITLSIKEKLVNVS
ncbi:MAG TPA: hypothetical protein GXZ48_01890, partial [Acholeplasmataceae bacterium]|nr:hypothetical protein [Acholeplasmataceae bacterium]